MGSITKSYYCDMGSMIYGCNGFAMLDFLVQKYNFAVLFFSKNCFSVRKVLTKRSGNDISRTLKKEERNDDLTRSKNNMTDDLASTLNKNKGTDDLAICKKNKTTCHGGGEATNSLISGLIIHPFFQEHSNYTVLFG